MRRLLFLALAGLVITNTGCFLNIYSSNPNRRMHELQNNSEDLRVIQDEWERAWFVDQPSHMVVDRVHGGMNAGIANNRPR